MEGKCVAGGRGGEESGGKKGVWLRWGKRREAEVREESAGVWVECG